MNTPRAKYLRKKYHIFLYTILIAIVLSIGGYYFYSHEEAAIKSEKYNDLIAISNLKINQLTQWLFERRSEAHFFSTNPNFIKNAINLSDGIDADSARKYFLSRLKPILESHDYENILITNKEKKIIFAVKSGNNHINDISSVMIDRGFEERQILFTDIFRCELTGRLMLEFIAPVFDKRNIPTAAIVFRINPTKYLYPLINSWPTPSKTAETLILRREGDSALFLNELRHKKNTALKHRLQIINKDVPAIQAVLGMEGIFEGVDYRGVDVLSFISKIPSTEWFMIAKVDKSEIYSELNFKAAVIVLFILLLILFSATGLSWIYHYNQRNLFRELFSKEKELSEFHKQFKTTLYSIGDGVITTDRNGKVKEMNPVAENLTGWKEADARGEELEKVFNIINETTRSKVENPVAKVLREGLVVGLANHTLLVSKDGNEIPISDSGAPINDENGNITGVVLVFRDQSEERKRNREILETSEQLKASQRVARIGYYVFDVSKGEWISSEMLDEIFGIDHNHKHDLIGWLDLIHPEDRQTMSDYLVNHVLKENNNFNREYRIINKNTKEILWVKGIGNLEHDDEGFPVKMFGTIQDISEMKIKEEKILQLSRAVEQNPISVIITSPDGTIQYINRKGCEMTGYSSEELIGNNPRIFKSGVHDNDYYENLWTTIIAGKDWKGEICNKRKDGIQYWESAYISPLFNNDNKLINFVAIKEDITERKKMMEELVAAKESAEIADKLKSEFLAQMSHEIRTPIHVILSYMGLIKSGMNLMSSDEVQSSFISIDSASKRIMRTIDLILNMAQIQTHSYEASFQYHDICNEIITKLDSEFSELAKQKGLYFRINNQCHKCKIEVDEYSVMQIFSNLIHNAIKYTDEGGVTVEIETNDELLIVRVIDTGIGMSKSYIKNLFAPFSQEEQGYSRKYEGNGLGLALVKSYCDINNAKIEIESEKGKGSTFTVTFLKS